MLPHDTTTITITCVTDGKRVIKTTFAAVDATIPEGCAEYKNLSKLMSDELLLAIIDKDGNVGYDILPRWAILKKFSKTDEVDTYIIVVLIENIKIDEVFSKSISYNRSSSRTYVAPQQYTVNTDKAIEQATAINKIFHCKKPHELLMDAMEYCNRYNVSMEELAIALAIKTL